jgi:hypothetical protein
MTIELLLPLLSSLVLVGGLGYKLNAELSTIRLMVEKLIVKADGKWERLDKLETRIEVLEKSKQCGK